MVSETLHFMLQLFKKKKEKHYSLNFIFEPGIPLPYSKKIQTIE